MQCKTPGGKIVGLFVLIFYRMSDIEKAMRFTSLIPAVVALIVSSPVFAQGWQEFISIEDRFGVNFPGEPTVQDITYVTEDGMSLPARYYSVQRGEEHYAVTSIDFADAYEAHDSTMQGALANAVVASRQRGEVTHDAEAHIDRIPAHQLQITEPNGHRLFMMIILHQNLNTDARRLYIAEASVPLSSPPPGLFQQSIEILDAYGEVIRYRPDGVTRQPTARRSTTGLLIPTREGAN